MPGPQDTGGQPYIDLVYTNAQGLNLAVTGNLAANSNPANANATSTFTGVGTPTLSALACTSSTVLKADPGLSVLLNEDGVYAIETELVVYASANGAAGITFDFNGGNVGIQSIQWGYMGYGTSFVAGLGNNSASGAQTVSTVATSINTASWIDISGVVTIKSPGNFAMRWSQAVSTPNAVYRGANSYMKLTKIG